MAKKIIVLNGSPRPKGNTAALAEEFSKGAREAGCGGGAPEKKAAAPVKGRALVVYYSRADENSGVGYIEKGNTKILAEFIAKATGADMFEIVPAKPYPKQYKPERRWQRRRRKKTPARKSSARCRTSRSTT